MARKTRYQQIADTIMEKISNGELQPGDALPSELDLKDQYGVSRDTIRQAIKSLVEEDILERIQGSGTYVKKPKVDYQVYQLQSFSESVADKSLPLKTDVLTFELMAADEILADIFELEEGTRLYHIERLRHIEGRPAVFEESWMPVDLFPEMNMEILSRSKYEYVEKTKGWPIDFADEEISARTPTGKISKLLNIEEINPIICKITSTKLKDGVTFDYGVCYFHPNEYKFVSRAYR